MSPKRENVQSRRVGGLWVNYFSLTHTIHSRAHTHTPRAHDYVAGKSVIIQMSLDSRRDLGRLGSNDGDFFYTWEDRRFDSDSDERVTQIIVNRERGYRYRVQPGAC